MNVQRKMLCRILGALLAFLAAVFTFHRYPQAWYVELMVFLGIYLLIGYDIALEAVGGIGRGQIFDENFLMVLATIGAFGTKQYPEAVAVMLFYQIGELFQRYAVDRSRGSIADLMDLRPDTAMVFRDGAFTEIAPEDIKVGEKVLVRPGERIPLDGIILRGESALDTSALTGESIPRSCGMGDVVLAGMVATSGALEIKVGKEFYDSTVSKILDMVENAAGKKAKTERFITRFSRYYTPIVVVLAIGMALIPPLFDGEWSAWISKALNFLVVSCPCALVISVPMSFFMGIGAASRQGVLVKGGSYLELLSKADVIVFDKTGTLTHGKFSVVNVVPQQRREEILRIAAIAESLSLHPIARSIAEAAGGVDASGWELEEIAGKGVKATKGNEIILVGTQQFMSEHNVNVDAAKNSETLVYVATNGVHLGCIEIADTLKDDAAEVISCLKAQGVNTVMLTGDGERVAKKVAEQAGVDGYHASLLPGDKVTMVEQMLQHKRKGALAFVGDGINDAPVLMRADLGIAMGAIGSDAAIEAADVVLMHDHLDSIIAAIKIAKRTMHIVMENIVFAIGIKLLVLALTPFGLVSVWLAIFADVGVAVIAILNAMRAGAERRK